MAAPFLPGSAIVWRSCPRGQVSTVLGCRVVADEPEVVALVQPTGAPVVRRDGPRGGPNGRQLLPGTWEGERRHATWDRPPAVRVHPVGRAYSVIRTWLADEERFDGWYVNLEQPWRRTAVGFDSCDDVLDVVVSDDLAEVGLKDEDELEFAVSVGLLSAGEAQGIRSNAESAMDDVRGRRWPFEESTWGAVRPVADPRPVELPPGWDAG